MQVVDKFIMLNMAVNDMAKLKEFYSDKLGLEITNDYRQDDENWWVTLTFPEGGVSMTLSVNQGNMKPGSNHIYFGTTDIDAAHKDLSDKGIKVGDVQTDLYGPGSGVKFVELKDPDGNDVLLVQE